MWLKGLECHSFANIYIYIYIIMDGFLDRVYAIYIYIDSKP